MPVQSVTSGWPARLQESKRLSLFCRAVVSQGVARSARACRKGVAWGVAKVSRGFEKGIEIVLFWCCGVVSVEVAML